MLPFRAMQGEQVTRAGQGGSERVSVVLFQLGGPDSLVAVEPFLYNLFSDPDIIDFPFAKLARQPLARLIASRRARKVRHHYEAIGGRSPLRELTERQAQALERELRQSLDARVFVAMRYWHPLTEAAVRQVVARAASHLVLLPLYPQYSCTTTGSSLKEWRRQYAEAGRDGVATRVIRDFFAHPTYIEAVVEKIDEARAKFLESDSGPGAKPADVHLLFSAHGVPLTVIEQGDPYQAQVEATVKGVIERGGWSNPWTLCYQSRSGPGRWLRPFLDEALERLAMEGVDKVLVIPISFVSDHIETLHELEIEARELAEGLGIRSFATMPALNDSRTFIRALSELVWHALERGRAPREAVSR